MNELIIMVGNIGSGKSFLASKFAKNGYVVVNMDSIQRMIGGGEYGMYDHAKKDVYHAAEASIVTTALNHGLNVIIDRTNMDRKSRKKFIELGKPYDSNIICYDFGCGNYEALERRLKKPHGIPEAQWKTVFANMAQNYEKPDVEEGFSIIYFPPKQFTFHAFDFDGTIVEHKFPEVGKIIYEKANEMKELWKDIHNVIIVWTCRSGDYENQSKAFLLKHRIPFDFINENPLFDMGSRKIFAHVYHDDRNAS